MALKHGSVLALVGVILLTGCQDVLVKKPDPLSVAATEKAVTLSNPLSQRNLQINGYGDPVLIDRQSCRIEISGHRGYFNAPENSLEAIKRGLAGGNDTVEIDIMLLRDGSWVLHHDTRTGRAVTEPGRNADNSDEVDRLSERQWRKLRHRDHETTRVLSNQPVPFIADAVNTIKQVISPYQKVNFEIKSKASLEQLSTLDLFIKRELAGRYYYSSSDLETLINIRSINPFVYLGLVNKPHPESIELLRAELSGKNERLSILSERKTRLANRLADHLIADQKKKTDWLTQSNLNKLTKAGYSNFGLHIDIRDAHLKPQIINEIKSSRYRVQTYGLNDPDEHIQWLASLNQRGVQPDGAIIDTHAYALCQALTPGVIPPALSNNDAEITDESLVLTLPADADFKDLETQRYYHDQGLYLSSYQGVKSKVSTSINNDYTPAKPTIPKRAAPGAIRDVDMDLKTNQSILIKVR